MSRLDRLVHHVFVGQLLVGVFAVERFVEANLLGCVVTFTGVKASMMRSMP